MNRTIAEKYWLTVFLTFLRYLSFLMMISGVAFIIAGWIANKWFYMGLISWPLFIMLGVVNIRYIHYWTKVNNAELNKMFKY